MIQRKKLTPVKRLGMENQLAPASSMPKLGGGDVSLKYCPFCEIKQKDVFIADYDLDEFYCNDCGQNGNILELVTIFVLELQILQRRLEDK